MNLIKFALFFSAIFCSILQIQSDDCLGLIFFIETNENDVICDADHNTEKMAVNVVKSYFSDPNGFVQGLYDHTTYYLTWRTKQNFIDFVISNEIACDIRNVLYLPALTDLYNFVKSSNYANYGIIWTGSSDIDGSDNASTIAAAQALASLNVPTFVWDVSTVNTNQQLFQIITHNRQDRIFSNPTATLDQATSFFMKEAIPLFQSMSCGTPPTLQPSVQPVTATSSVAVSNPTTAPTNTSCVGLELMFILDRSQSMVPTIYNNDIKRFVNSFVQGYTFPEETDGDHLGYIRLGVIQFSDTPEVTIPLGNYSRIEFSSMVNSYLDIGNNSGVNNLQSALLAAYTQFQHESTLQNRAIILIVDDVSLTSIHDSIDALTKLKSFVNLPMGVIVPGFSGSPAEGLSHLLILLGNDTKLAFPDLASASAGAPALISNKYPCQLPAACSALIFLEETTVAVGASSKLSFLRLAAQLAAASAQRSSQRFAISLFGGEIYHGIELQTFTDFNATINAFIDTMAADNFPDSGVTYLDPVLTQLQQVYGQGLVKNMTVVLISETESLRNPSAANRAAQRVAALGLNFYVLDASRFTIPGNLFKTLTNNAYGHVLNTTFTDPMTFNNLLLGSAIDEFNDMRC